MSEYIAQVFGQDGLMAQRFQGYQARPGQVEMALAVERIMQQGGNLLVEAPTGVGKSAGYLVPGCRAASKGERVVVVTANIALQEQVVGKDLPMLRKVLPFEFTFAIAKGLGNYLCKQAVEETEQDVQSQGLHVLGGPLNAQRWQRVQDWAKATSTGDLSELSFVPEGKLATGISTTPDDCTGQKCPKYSECWAMAARQAVHKAQVVVTNYHLFFINMQIKRAGGKGVLPPYKHVVLDEGHKAAGIAQDFLGFRMSAGTVKWAASLLNSPQGLNARKGPLPEIDKDLRAKADAAADALFEALGRHFASKEYRVRFRRPMEGELKRRVNDTQALLIDCKDAYNEAVLNYDGLTEERQRQLKQHADKCAELAGNLAAVCGMEARDWVYYLEDEQGRVSLKGKPVSVSRYLQKNLFEFKDGSDAIKSVTVTSATLATGQGDFKFVQTALGAANSTMLQVESPFDLERNMHLVVPPMPEPNSERFAAEVGKQLVEVINLAGGRTLCLFTSHRMLNEAYRYVQGKVPFKVLKQGDQPRTQLIQQFKEDVTSVLMGTESFWAGVDVPGESLSCVVIDRLPFPSVSDPLQDFVKGRLGKRYFGEVSVPTAVIAFRQGVGRLIRSTEDRGCVVVLDNRIVESNYGRKFTKAFPQGVQLSQSLRDLAEFFGRPVG